MSEGLAVQAKPNAMSPWRGPGQLSGGQVALVGLALNLATQVIRPAPFYLVDEVRRVSTGLKCAISMDCVSNMSVRDIYLRDLVHDWISA